MTNNNKIKFYALDNEGNRGEEVEYDGQNEYLGVLLKNEQIDGIGYIGHFSCTGLPSKRAVLQIHTPLIAGALIKFNIMMYNRGMLEGGIIPFSTASFTILDAKLFYENFKIIGYRNLFKCDILNFEVRQADSRCRFENAFVIHPVFGRIEVKNGKVDSDTLYSALPLESSTLTGSNIYIDMKTYKGASSVNGKHEKQCLFQVNRTMNSTSENDGCGEMQRDRSGFSAFLYRESKDVESSGKVASPEYKPSTSKCRDSKNGASSSNSNVKILEDEACYSQLTTVVKRVDENVGPSEIDTNGITEPIVCKPIASTCQVLTVEPFEIDTTDSDTKQIGVIERNETQLNREDNRIATVVNGRKMTLSECKPTTSTRQDTKTNVIEQAVARETVEKVKRMEESVQIKSNETDTKYGIVWVYDQTLAHIFCHNVDKKSVIVDTSGSDKIPVGGLVKFSMLEYKQKLVTIRRKVKVSTVALTYIPNHGLYNNFEYKVDWRHLLTLENYEIKDHQEMEDHYEFIHPILGTIKDRSKVIQDVVYKKIQLTVARNSRNFHGMGFMVDDVSKAPIVTKEEKELRLLPTEKRMERMAELLKMEEDRNMLEEMRKWEVLGIMELKNFYQLNSRHGMVPFFIPQKNTPLVKAIMKKKVVNVCLQSMEDDGKMCIEEFPYGFITPFKNGFCFTPKKVDPPTIFEIGDQYKFVPKCVEKSVDYYAEGKYLDNKLINVAFPPDESNESQPKKAEKMYNMAVDGADPGLIGNDYVLNEQQEKAVRMALNESRKIVLIHGPPGTGKTHTLAELIVQFVLRKKKIMVIAPTNCAIDNVYQLTMELLRQRRLHKQVNGLPTLLTYEKVNEQMERFDVMRDNDRLRKAYVNGHIGQERCDREINRNTNYVMRTLLKSALVCLCTTNSSFVQLSRLNGFETDTAIVDEAAMVLESHLWASVHNMERIIMAGDPKQLPALVKFDPDYLDKNESANYGKSVMELLMDIPNNPNYIMLTLQYRMKPEVMRIASELFYEGKLTAHESVENIDIRDLLANNPENMPTGLEQLLKPVVFCETTPIKSGTVVKMRCFDKLVDSDGGRRVSYCNPGEAWCVVKYVEILLNQKLDASKMSIITPYAAQVLEIEELLRKTVKTQNEDIKVGTIDAFQGKENDIVIVSLVRNNPRRSIGFLLDDKRFNVLLTRAKRQLFLIGNSSSFLFNNRGKMPQFANLLTTTNAVITRSYLGDNKTFKRGWDGKQRDQFGSDFRDYLKFNPDDVKMRKFIVEFLENKSNLVEDEKESDNEDTE